LINSGAALPITTINDPATGQTLDASTGKPVTHDPTTGKIVDAITGMPIVKDPVTGETIEESDVKQEVEVTKDPVTG